MKRIKIWLNNFTLLQQFLAIVSLTGIVLLFFIFTFLNKNVDYFVNNQMYVYIHRSQAEYIETRRDSKDSNVVNFVYNASSQRYLSNIPTEYKGILANINPDPGNGIYDGSLQIKENSIVYSVATFDEDYRLISIIKNTFRDEFRNALLSSVIYVTFYVIGGLMILILLWVISLLSPLNRIINYINHIKNGEKATLSINRGDEIGQVSEALVNMNAELSRQQHIRDEMIQNISHDLKTPIATIKSYSESIKDGIYPYDTLEKSVDVITDNANRLEKKVYSLITYNKMDYLKDKDANILNLKMAPVVRNTILACKVLRNDIKIKTNINEEALFHGDEEPWRVVAENLLENALRYAKSKIIINVDDNFLEIFNDGEQIDEANLEKMFKPYEKGNKGKFGLGLSIVKKVAETYGYTVTGENETNGVVFRVYTMKKMKKLPKKKESKKGIIES